MSDDITEQSRRIAGHLRELEVKQRIPVVREVIEALEELDKVDFDWMGTDTFEAMVKQVAEQVKFRVDPINFAVKLNPTPQQPVVKFSDLLEKTSLPEPPDRVILQNAIRIKHTGQILISTHRHDYVTDPTGKYMLDGGRDYLRRSIFDAERVDDLTLYDDDPIEQKVHKLLWGTLGKDGTGPRQYIFLHDAETDHLKKILEIPNIMGAVGEVCREILAKRRVNPTWGINYTFEQIKDSFV
jgi:hypothetical protein